jgi:hypothetical protein
MWKIRNCAARTALDSSPLLFVEHHKVVVPFRRSFGALIFAVAAMLATAQPDPATAEDRGAIPLQAGSGCIVGHRFTPGPIAGGHNHQPTIPQFQARMRELRELEQRDAYRCVVLPAGDEAITHSGSWTSFMGAPSFLRALPAFQKMLDATTGGKAEAPGYHQTSEQISLQAGFCFDALALRRNSHETCLRPSISLSEHAHQRRTFGLIAKVQLADAM